MLILRKVAQNSQNTMAYLPVAVIAGVLSTRHLFTSRYTFSEESGEKKSGYFDWARSAEKSILSTPCPETTNAFDNYTLNIVKDFREKASSHKSSIQEVLSVHKNKINQLKNTLSSPLDFVDILDIIPGSIIDDNTKSSLRDLSLVCENIISQYQRTINTFNHPFLVNLGLLRLLSIQRSRQIAADTLAKTCAAREKGRCRAVDDADEGVEGAEWDVFLAEARHFLRFADDVYEEKGSSLYLSPSEVLARELGGGGAANSTLLRPRYVVFLDHLTESVVVVIRGTASVSDIITDLHCSTRPFINDSLHAHTGISASAEALLPAVQAALERGRSIKGGAFRDYKVVVTGHSLGAGTACLLSLLLAHNAPMQHFITFAFAPPPILAKDESSPAPPQSGPSALLTKAAQVLLNPSPHALPRDSPALPRNLTIHSFVHNEDLIPRCSMHEFVNMLAAVDAIDKCPHWSASDRAAMLIRGELSGEELQILTEVLSTAAASKERELRPSEDRQLIIPGHVYWLLPRGAGSSASSSISGRKTVETSPEGEKGGEKREALACSVVRMQACGDIFSGSLFTGDSMFQDHQAGSYRRAMVSVDTRLD